MKINLSNLSVCILFQFGYTGGPKCTDVYSQINDSLLAASLTGGIIVKIANGSNFFCL